LKTIQKLEDSIWKELGKEELNLEEDKKSLSVRSEKKFKIAIKIWTQIMSQRKMLAKMKK